jgi:hypothetical protein
MKTDKELKRYAIGAADGHFYCDDECETPWEPFEDWPAREIRQERDNLAGLIFNAMKWAQNANNKH